MRYPTCCPLVRFPKGASKMLRATGHARMVTGAARAKPTRRASPVKTTSERISPNQVLTHAARAAARHLRWPRAKGSGYLVRAMKELPDVAAHFHIACRCGPFSLTPHA